MHRVFAFPSDHKAKECINLSVEQRRVIEEYTRSGYGDINKCLREKGASRFMPKNVLEQVKTLQEMFQNIPTQTFPSDYVLYRGFFTPKMMTAKVGDFIQDLGFVSTSESVETAFDFSRSCETDYFGDTKCCCVVEISFLPDVEYKALPICNMTTYDHEYEILFPPFTSFKIKEITSANRDYSNQDHKVFKVVMYPPDVCPTQGGGGKNRKRKEYKLGNGKVLQIKWNN